MESSKKYEYILEQPEIREFSFHAFMEQLKCSKKVRIRLILIYALCLIGIPRLAVWLAILIAAVLLLAAVRLYFNTKKIVSGQQWTVWLEESVLKVYRDGSHEVPCSNIHLTRTTRRLLMLGYLNAEQHLVWIIMPLRVFVKAQERECFLDRIRHPREIEGGDTDEEAEGMRFIYTLDERRWVQFRRDAEGIIASGTFGRRKRMCAALFRVLLLFIFMLFFLYLAEGYLNWLTAGYGLGVVALLTARQFLRDPEKSFRKQVKMPAVRDKECGVWQIALSETGVCVRTPGGMKNNYAWEKFEWLVETGDAFYLFHKDRIHYELIAKESFSDKDQISAMHMLCAQKNVKSIQGREMHYLPDWGLVLLAVLLLVLYVVISFISVFGSSVWEKPGQRHRIAQEQREMYYQEDFGPADYLDYVPLDKQVETMESFGLQVPGETVESMWEFMTEYGMQNQIEGNPYTWLLTSLGAPKYDEDGKISGYSQDVFWFDFEGIDISTDYIDVLNGMLALAKGSCLDTVTDISEDTAKVNWEKGKGTVTVSLEWEGETYHWDMDVKYDWIDGEVLGVLNTLLIQGDSEENFYMTGDNGQGAIVFFCTEEWAENFREATGLELVKYVACNVEQKE